MSAGERTIPGTVFQLLPRRPNPADVGYDGQGIEYRERVVRAANEKVSESILSASADRNVILSYWGKCSDDEYARMGAVAEELFIKDLTNPHGFVAERYVQSFPSDGKEWKGQKASILEMENGMNEVENVKFEEVCATVLAKQNVVARLAKGASLIDAAGPGRKVYQVTISPEHDMPLNAIETLCRDLGYIGEDGKIVPENSVDKFEFYWVVPIGSVRRWRSKGPFMYKASRTDSKKGLETADKVAEANDIDKEKEWARKVLVNDLLSLHVVQYVLPMTTEVPITYSNFKDGESPW